jgi:hypothetical protein
MKRISVSLCLIVVGLLVIMQGTRRDGSIVGVADSVGTRVANAWDGKGRQPEHVWYYLGGGVLMLAGIAGLVRRKKS